MSLADLLESQGDPLVQRWAERLRGSSSASSDDARGELTAAVETLARALRGHAIEPAPLRLTGDEATGYTTLRELVLDLAREASVTPSLDEVQALLGFFTRSQSLEAAAVLRTSEGRYRALFESIDDGFCIFEMLFDTQGKCVDYRFLIVNAAFESQTGLRDAVGRRMRDMVPAHEEHWFQLYGQVAMTGESIRFEQHAAGLDDRWYEVYASRVEPAEARQVACLFKDISGRKRSEQERERLLSELTRSNQELDQFAHVASHDLRAPLRGIASLSQWIEDDLGDEVNDETRQNLHLMRNRVQRMDALITGILDYATAGRAQAKAEAVDMSRLLAEVVELLAPPAHIAITLRTPLPTVVAERVALQQVFLNLIGNAVKHTQQPGAAITVAAVDEGEFVHFTVADNGPGIAPEYHERIWGVFQKLTSATGVEGTGIGLSVVKKLVESRGGRAWVESSEGHGATFHVLWPRRAASADTVLA